jgi:hypothetical protein
LKSLGDARPASRTSVSQLVVAFTSQRPAAAGIGRSGARQVSSLIASNASIGHPEPMTYGVTYAEEGNFLNWYEQRSDAERAVLEVVDQDPGEAEEFGYFAFDDAGQRVGEFTSGADLLARRGAAA